MLKRSPTQWVMIMIVLLCLAIAGSAYTAEPAQALFKAKCAMCHGADASGNTPMGKKFNIPDLHAPDIQKRNTAELSTAIAKGKNKMPAFEGKLTPSEINDLAIYIRQIKK